MINPYPLGTSGPLNRETAELGTGGLRNRLPLTYTPPPSGVTTGGPLPPTPAPTPTPTTGGGLPPSSPTPTTGGPLPPSTIPTNVHTGGPGQVFPGTPTGVQTGGPLPPSTNGNTGIVPPWVQTGGPLPPQQVPGQSGPQASMAPVDVVQQMIDGMMKGQYGQDARRRGLELANQRGLLNGSMAAGSSQRAALEAITPFVQQGMGLLGQREQNAFQGEQAQRDRDLREKLQSDSTFQQDWLNSRNFNRDFYAKIASLPIENAAQFSQMIAQYALENPEVYTPDNIAGMTQFFSNNFRDILSSYLGDIDFGGL